MSLNMDMRMQHVRWVAGSTVVKEQGVLMPNKIQQGQDVVGITFEQTYLETLQLRAGRQGE